MRQIAIYFEGNPLLTEGLKEFLNIELALARHRRVRIDLIVGGPKGPEKLCQTGQKVQPKATHFILLDYSDKPRKGAPPKNTFYWIQVMESWFLADPAAIRKALGPCVNIAKVPKWKTVESISKPDVFKRLSSLTKICGKEKHYDDAHPPNLASKILRQLDRKEVQEKSPECRRFLTTLDRTILKLGAETK